MRRRGLWAVITSIFSITALCGCSINTWFPMPKLNTAYGPPAVPLEIKSFTFAPLGPIHPGDSLTFTAEIEPVSEPQVRVWALPGQPGDFMVELHDDGVAPDAQAGDNVFTGQGTWGVEYGTGKFTLRLSAASSWQEYKSGTADRILKVKP